METGKQTHEIYEAPSFDKFGRLVFSSSSVSTKEATEGMKATLQKDNNGAPDGTIKDVCNYFNRQLTLTISAMFTMLLPSISSLRTRPVNIPLLTPYLASSLLTALCLEFSSTQTRALYTL